MKKLFFPLLLMVALSAYSSENPVLTILTDLQKMRQASTETVFALNTLYFQINSDAQQAGGPMPAMFRGLPFMPMIDGYVSVKSFDDATREGTLADVPYMIGFKLNDKDAEASVFGNPEIAPQYQGFPFGGGAPAPRR